MENFYNKFRKMPVGGFHRKDVIDYIEKIQNEFYQYKVQTEKTVNELNDRIRELEALSEGTTVETAEKRENTTEKRDTTQDLMPADEINVATGKLKSVADELCQSLSDFMDKLSENSIAVMLNVPLGEENEAILNVIDSAETAPESVLTDPVQSILNSASSIFAEKNETINSAGECKKCEQNNVKKPIDDILTSFSFVC